MITLTNTRKESENERRKRSGKEAKGRHSNGDWGERMSARER